MTTPGGRYGPAFVAEVGRCWAVVHDHNLQAIRCAEPPTHTGRWRSPEGGRWWQVWSCGAHLEDLTAIRATGWRRST